MLHLARMVYLTPIMTLTLSVIIGAIVLIKVSIICDNNTDRVRYTYDMNIIGHVGDPYIQIKGFTLVPLTKGTYIPNYAYYKDGEWKTTYSYKKCKREMSRLKIKER